jgi:hypothetical protein
MDPAPYKYGPSKVGGDRLESLIQFPQPPEIMDLQITGEVSKILPEETGEGKNGTWRKQAFVLKTPGDYPKDVCIIQWGDAIDKNAVQAGETITAHIDIQSREYNSRWYTDVKAWKVERKGGGGSGGPAGDEPPFPDEPEGLDEEDVALPF